MLKECVLFFIKPKVDSTIYKKPIRIFHLMTIGFLLCLFGIILTTIIQELIVKYVNVDFDNFDRLNYPINTKNFFLTVFVSPILEELGFRLFLKPIKNVYIPISFSILCFSILSFFFGNQDIYYLLIISLLFFFLSFYFSNKIISFTKNHYSFIFYLTAIIFSLLHLKTFNSFSQIQRILFPIIIIPYFFYAISFSYVRMKSNIFWAILLHIIINGIAFSLKYLSTLIQPI